MGMKRTTVFADEADLAIIKGAAAAEGVSEAEIIREAIHLAAVGRRRWSEPFLTTPPGPRVSDATVDDVYDELAADYLRLRAPVS